MFGHFNFNLLRIKESKVDGGNVEGFCQRNSKASFDMYVDLLGFSSKQANHLIPLIYSMQ